MNWSGGWVDQNPLLATGSEIGKKRFIEATSLTDVTSNFAMEEIKNSTEIYPGNFD